MDNFRRLAFGLDVQSVLDEIREDMWHEHTLRQSYPGSAHRDTESIYLRWAPEWTYKSIFMTTAAVDYPTELPAARALVQDVAGLFHAKQVGRAMVTRLKPGGVISPHVDEGLYAEHYRRYHVALASEEGNEFTVDDETVHMAPGELWWFNHRKEHAVANHSQVPRLHLIVDLA